MDNTKHRHRSDWTKRPIFRDPERYSPERFNRISEYHSGRFRHALLGIAGTGIVYGYDVETDEEGCCRVQKGAVYITCGLAIDACGRMLYWPGGWVGLDAIAGHRPEEPGPYTLRVHYAERRWGHDDQCGCDREEAAWVEEGVAFSLEPGCGPACDGCPEYCGECISTNTYVCGRTGSNDNAVPVDPYLGNICKEPGQLCHVGCGDWLYDADMGLDLACVGICERPVNPKLGYTELEFCCDEPKICSVRRYVYRNPLLYELIQGCHYDLARIRELNFEMWLRNSFEDPVQFTEFSRIVREGLTVHFTKPIAKATLTPASVFVTAVVREQDSFFNDVLRLPTSSFEFHDEQGDYAGGVTLHFQDAWLKNQLDSDLSRFNFGGTVEFTVRCAMLEDECGCMPDAQPLRRNRGRRGDCPLDKPAQQMPGDDFVVAFCVAARPVTPPKKEEDEKRQDDKKYDDDEKQQAPTPAY
ncbi:MAG: hypothetical protein AAF350_02100 [Pseudomonadota bacterium]